MLNYNVLDLGLLSNRLVKTQMELLLFVTQEKQTQGDWISLLGVVESSNPIWFVFESRGKVRIFYPIYLLIAPRISFPNLYHGELGISYT